MSTQSPNILALETATNACSAALQIDGNTIGRFEIAPQKQAEKILPMIDALLHDANVALSDLDAIAFGMGPGSFMGVRLAVSISQGLAFGADLPLIPISTLKCLAQSACMSSDKIQTEGLYLPAWDARMSELYFGIYRLEEGVMVKVQEDQLVAPNQLLLPDHPNLIAIGNAWSVYREQLSKDILKRIGVLQTDIYPNAKAMLPLAVDAFLKKHTVSALQAQPLYLRIPEFSSGK